MNNHPGLFAQHTDRFYCWKRWCGLWHRSRISNVVKIQIILAQGEWSSAKGCWTNPQKMQTQDSNKHSVIWRMFVSSTLQASVFMGKEYSEILCSIKSTGNNLTMKQMFDISEKLIVRTIRWDLWSEYKLLGKFFMETSDREVHQNSFWYISSAHCGPRNAVSVPQFCRAGAPRGRSILMT